MLLLLFLLLLFLLLLLLSLLLLLLLLFRCPFLMAARAVPRRQKGTVSSLETP